MISIGRLKSVDFYRKIPRDLTEASLSGAGLSIIAALFMMFLFGMELNDYLTVSTSTSVIVDKSTDGEFLRIEFNISFPALSCEFASVDVSDVLGTNRLNITKTVRKFSIDRNLIPTGSEFHPGPLPKVSRHGDDNEEEYGDSSVSLTANNFDKFSHQYPILVVNFYAPWCYWSNRLKPSWERTTKIIRERYDPEMDGRILLGKVDCTEEAELCRRHHVQGYPSIRIFRRGSDIKEDHGHHDHESYYGERDTESLVAAMESLVAPVPREPHKQALEDKSEKTIDAAKRPAPLTSGCRVEGFVRVKKDAVFFEETNSSAQHRCCAKMPWIGIKCYATIAFCNKNCSQNGKNDKQFVTWTNRCTIAGALLCFCFLKLKRDVKDIYNPTKIKEDENRISDYVKCFKNEIAGVPNKNNLYGLSYWIWRPQQEQKEVPGNLIISARSRAHSFDASQINVSHVISRFSFGKKLSIGMLSEIKRITPYLGGRHDQLTGRSYMTNHADDVNASVTIEHYLQIVKTEIVSRRSSQEFKLLEDYEYTAHSSLVQSLGTPVAKFHFEPSPMQVLVTEVPKSFSHFITNVCAIIGGVFTVAGILDSILHNTIRLMRKVELGKHI